MAAILHTGPIEWRLTISEEGHREYVVAHRVSAAYDDGPQVVVNCSGLPAIGDTWVFGNDSDSWAFCTPKKNVTPVLTEERNTVWKVESTFTTKSLNRCQDTQIEDPLDEPAKISGSFVKFTREAYVDKDGDRILTSSLEQIRGKEVERDDNRPTVNIEMNVATLPLSTFAPMIDTLNDATLWGLPARCVKLSNVSWERKTYGVCNFYYTVSYEFEINYDTFDKTILDEGTRVLAIGGDPTNPEDFGTYKDPITDENAKVILDGNGEAWNGVGSPGTINVQLYTESNFNTLGIPGSL